MATITKRQPGSKPAADEQSPSVDPESAAGTGGAARFGLWFGPALFLVLLLLPTPAGLSTDAKVVAAVALLMATWWMTEALPLPATSLLPIVLFPAFGIMSTGEATAPFANHVIFSVHGRVHDCAGDATLGAASPHCPRRR